MSNNQNGVDQNQTGAEKGKKTSAISSRSLKYGSLATVITVVFVVIVVLLNLVLSTLNSRFSLGIDLTNDKTYALTDTTTKYISSLKNDVTVYVLATQQQMLSTTDYAETLKIIQQYPLHTSHVKVEYVDLDANPTFKSKYPDESLNAGDVIVTDGNKYKHITASGYLQQSTDQTTGQAVTVGYSIENNLDSAIAYLSATNLQKVVMTTGHNEGDTTGLGTLLKNNNYSVISQNISNTEIPSDASAIAIFDPKSDLSSEEISKIDTFLNNNGNYGKNLMVFFDPTQPSLPNLEGFVKEWGIQVEKGAIYDETNSYSTFQPLAGSIESSVIKNTTTSVNSDLANSRALTLVFNTKDIRSTKSVVATANTAKLWNPTGDIASADFSKDNHSGDKSGPFTVLALGTKTGSNGTSNVLVSGSADIVNSTLLKRSDLNNDKLIIGSVNTITGYKSPITVDSKEKTSDALNFTTTQAYIFGIVFILAIPLAMLAMALITYLRRRHL